MRAIVRSWSGVTLRTALAIALAAMPALPAAAGTAGSGAISILFAVPNAIVFAHNGARSGAPGCATGGWAVASSTVAGQSMTSVLLAAYAMHKRIWIQGDGSCSVWGDRETIQYFGIED